MPTDPGPVAQSPPPALPLAPVAAGERLQALDALRGIALLGILLSNAPFFSAPLADLGDGVDPALRGLDRWATMAVHVAVRHKFWTVFSLLFGMGFAVMGERAGAAGRDFRPLYLRRSFGLLAIGLAHAWLVWSGDILVTYAACAFLLYALRGLGAATQWRLGLSLYAVPCAFLLLLAGLLALPGVADGDPQAQARGAAERAQAVAAYAHGSYAEATAQRLREFVGLTLSSASIMVPLALGLFLIGAGLARSGVLADPAAHRGLWHRLLWGGLASGAALTAASLAIDPAAYGARLSARTFLASTLHMIGALPLALSLVAAVVLSLARGWRWPRPFIAPGRIALSLYLMQSLVGTWVFYGYGLGLWGRIAPAPLFAAAAGLFVLQLLLAQWWLRRFRFGPAEWLWRAFTYWRLPPWRAARA
ncbi:DUF418 domain-containing protein [Lysobacter sp. BMK333-48F3]|uniref:DUF418 domain-containing protein n=1 Tax=Lysobacter sp. BMK333-48F3 TaxID=2867962 RepID=UPI0021046BB1|nr:DUF418 domain-containing protein [Lysobacter sp. BMK333-48F3]